MDTLEEIKEKAKNGCVNAQNNLAAMYYYGNGTPQDLEQAFNCFKKSAEHDDDNAQFYLGLMYESGEGVEQNYEQALYWYQKAAEQGYMDAQNAVKRIKKKLQAKK